MVCLRNPLRSINRLPPEILALCAAFVPRTDPWSILSLIYVCRYWREVITADPGSWTLIDSGWKRSAPLCPERTGTAPLTANILASDIKSDKCFLQTLLPHLHRISNISLTGYVEPYGDIQKIFAGLFVSPMPNITSLSLDFPRIPPHFIPSDIKSLVELKLAHYCDPFQNLIELLESNPNLEVVELDIGSWSAEASGSTTQERAVSLPRLQHLEITCGHPSEARTLFSSLSLPRGVKIGVQGSNLNPCVDLAPFLPHPPTPIRDVLAPVTTIKYLRYVGGGVHLFGNGGSFSFHSGESPGKMYEGMNLFAIGAVRELHIGRKDLNWPLKRLSALEALVIIRSDLDPGFLYPLMKPSLKTIAFFDCVVTQKTIDELKKVAEKRGQSETAVRLYRVVVVNHRVNGQDVHLIFHAWTSRWARSSRTCCNTYRTPTLDLQIWAHVGVTSATYVNAIVGPIVVADVRVKYICGISNTTLSIRIVLARTPLPDLSIVDMSLARRMPEVQESAREDGDGILVVGDAREFASEFAVDVVGEVLVSDLRRGNVRPSIVEGSLLRYALGEVRNHSK